MKRSQCLGLPCQSKQCVCVCVSVIHWLTMVRRGQGISDYCTERLSVSHFILIVAGVECDKWWWWWWIIMAITSKSGHSFISIWVTTFKPSFSANFQIWIYSLKRQWSVNITWLGVWSLVTSQRGHFPGLRFLSHVEQVKEATDGVFSSQGRSVPGRETHIVAQVKFAWLRISRKT